ncbi:MAG: NAD(P)-binding protein, partial [Acidimicrobiales bacterium]|nr:NAD(P)-binding protein [Acidimicrobiales bacterium]
MTIEEVRARYQAERAKRIRPEGNAQFRSFSGEFADFDTDPWVEPGFTRDPLTDDTTAVIVGGGFAGMLTAINLTRHGIRNFIIVEKAGDFGGTWYWNRYP